MILEVVIKYDPYHKATYMTVDGLDVTAVPDSAGYGKFKEQIEKKNPIQTWLERRGNWKGILNELIPEESSDNLTFLFTGRKIDYEDLMHACESQNEERKSRCHLKFDLEYEITDEQTARNIEEVVKTLQSDRFKKLVDECNQLGFDKELGEKYKNFKADYDRARNAEFTITVAGIFSSGKSTIINSLIRHNALPVSYKTCTKKVCKIRDNPELKPNELNLLICDENKLLKKKACFSDADKAVNDKKCSELIESIKAESGDTILEANLGHLYPNEKSREMFKLVIVDTPGTDSNKAVNKEGINIDENTALNAVFDSKDEMVILSIKADDVDSGGLTRLIKAISNKFGGNKDGDKDSVGDSFVYNDRFLFVANKCDQIPFNHEETTTDFINRYRETLKNETKNPSFNPRIFPLCAAVPAYQYFKDEESWNIQKTYRDKVFGCKDEDEDITVPPNPFYHFYNYCDVPQYKKENYEKEFSTAETKKKALLISSGFVCLEDAIKDYIERFAYPRRIERILDTYRTIPSSVINCIKAQETALKKAKESLEKAQDDGKIAEEREKEEKEMAYKLERTKSVIEELKKKVDDFSFDASAFYEIKKKLDHKFDEIKIDYGAKKITLEEANTELAVVRNKVKSLLNDYSLDMKNMWNELMQKLKSAFYAARSNLESEKAQGTFNIGGFDFSQSEAFNGFSDFGAFDSGNFDFGEYVYTEFKEKPNPEKDMFYEWWQIFSKIGQFFAPDTVTESRLMVNFGKFVLDRIAEIEGRVYSSTEKMKNEYATYYDGTIKRIKGYIDEISKLFESAVTSIAENEMKAMNSKKTAQEISSSISSILSDKEFMEELNKKILVILP